MNKQFTLKKDILPTQKELPNTSISKLMDEYLNLNDFNLILFDLETLGLSPSFDYEQITEISAKVIDGKNFDTITSLNHKIELNDSAKTLLTDPNSVERLNWENRQRKRNKAKFTDPNELLKLTHYRELSNDTLTSEKDAIKEFIDLIENTNNCLLVAHNAKFDVRFLTIRASKYDARLPITSTLDTLKLSRYYFAPLIEKLSKEPDVKQIHESLFRKRSNFNHISSKLGELAESINLNAENWHSAKADVNMMLGVLKFMLNFFDKHRDEDIKKYQQRILQRNIGRKKSK